MNARIENRCLARAKELLEKREFYASGIGSKLRADDLILEPEDIVDLRSLPTIEEAALFLLFCRQYYITKRKEEINAQ